MSLRHLIIGHGPAGLTAAEAIRSRQADASITIIGEEPYPFYSRPGLAYYLANEVPQEQLFSRPGDYYRRWQITALQGHAECIDPDRRVVLLTDGRQLTYDRLLLATGSAAMRPEVPGSDLAGVVTLNSLSDTQAILQAMHHAKTAVVVGGGLTALEFVEGFRRRGLQTHYLMRHAHFWPTVLTPAESELIQARLSEEGVLVHTHMELARIHGTGGRVAAVETVDGQRWPCQVAGVAIGVRPRVELAQQTGLRTARGVLVDATMRTNAPHVFAAGDIAQLVEGTGPGKLDLLWPAAIETGRVAGANMAGGNVHYARSAAFNVCRLAGIPAAIIGQVGSERVGAETAGRGSSEAWQTAEPLLAVTGDRPPLHQRLHLRADRLAGAVLLGDQTLAPAARFLIEKNVDISPIRAALLAPHADLAGILLPFYAQVRAEQFI